MVITTKDKLDCAKRELAMRKQVYPKRIKDGKMTEYESTHEITCMEAIVRDYQKQLDTERGQTKMDL